MHRSSSQPTPVTRRPLSTERPLPSQPPLNSLRPLEGQQGVIFEQDGGALDVVTEAGGAFMRLPGGWRDNEALLSVIDRVKGGQGAWISAGALHLPGPRAGHVLTKLAVALRVLRVLDVKALDVLRDTPALMVDGAKQPVKFTLDEHGACLKGDARWLQSLIGDLACHFPSLACRVFLDLLDRRAKWTLLSHHPSVFDALVARVENKEDQEALQAYFQRELASEMKGSRGARYIAVWMARCPPWAEASLHDIWSTHGEESTKKGWQEDHPALSQTLAQWAESFSSTPGARIDDPGRQQSLEVELIKPSNEDTQYICNHFKQILQGSAKSAKDRESRYKQALKRYQEKGQVTQFFFHCALSSIATALKTTTVESEPLEWLLSRLFNGFALDFSVIASSALAHLVASPCTKELPLGGRSRDETVAFTDFVQVWNIVCRMIGWCHATLEFQSGLRLTKEVKDELAALAGQDLFVWLAPTGQKDGFKKASWKVQLLWRDEWLKDRGLPIDDHRRAIETAAILNAALDQEDGDGLQDQDMDDIVSYVLKDKSSDWLHSLLRLNPIFTARPKFRGLVACLAARCASDAYIAEDRTRATEFIAMLCKSPFLFDDDLERAASSMTAVAAIAAITLEAIKPLEKALSPDQRGRERMYLWAYFLERSVQSDQSDRVAETVRYLELMHKGREFKYLTQNGPKVRGLFERYRLLASQVVEEEGGAFMRLSSTWENKDFLSALQRVKGVQGEPWISGGVLHLQGTRAGNVLGRLGFAFEFLAALGMRHEEDVLRVLLRTPVLMVHAREPGVRLTVADGRPFLTGDVQWLQSVIVNLASHAPSLACLVFLCMAPQDQWTLLTRYPPTFDVLTARIVDEADRESLLAHFQSGLTSEMKQARDPQRIAVWMARCPSWAEATLCDILSTLGDPHMADPWRASMTAAPTDEVRRRLNPDPEALVARYQPDANLERVRSAKYPQEGGLIWRTGVRYIRYQFHQILRGARDRELRYGNAVEAINCIRRENRADLFFSCAFIVLSHGLKNGDVHGDALGWLLDRLYKNFARHFSAAASYSFAQHLPWLLEDRSRLPASTQRYPLQLPWREGSLAIPFAKLDHATQVLAHMIGRCGADQAFQSQLRLHEDVKRGLMALFPSTSTSTSEALASLAPAGFKEASWKVQLLWRDDGSGPKPRILPLKMPPQTFDLTADILKNALDQGGGDVRDGDMDDIVAYVLSGASGNWIKSLLERYPTDPKYRALVVCLVVKCASSAYVDGNDQRATELIALLCESTIVTGNDLRAATKYMKAGSALTQKAIAELLRVLSPSERAQERMCLWACLLVSSGPGHQDGGIADTLKQLGLAFRTCKFKRLEQSERLEVVSFLAPYRSDKGKLSK